MQLMPPCILEYDFLLWIKNFHHSMKSLCRRKQQVGKELPVQGTPSMSSNGVTICNVQRVTYRFQGQL